MARRAERATPAPTAAPTTSARAPAAWWHPWHAWKRDGPHAPPLLLVLLLRCPRCQLSYCKHIAVLPLLI